MPQARGRVASPPRPDPWGRIDAPLTWEDLVLPPDSLSRLRSVPELLSERYWTGSGPGDDTRRGALLLFIGGAGTGKTLAAQVLAAEMGLPILRADLESLFARGRGEASRLLTRLFATAQRLGGVLELDRGDFVVSSAPALDRAMPTRVATADLRDLLDRCESHPGVVVFPTASQREIDDAARARFDATIVFPFPERDERLTIWRRALPLTSAVSEADLAEIAEAFQLPGAAIAACGGRADRLAAAEGSAVRLPHIVRALEDEYATRLASDPTRAALEALRARAQAPAPRAAVVDPVVAHARVLVPEPVVVPAEAVAVSAEPVAEAAEPTAGPAPAFFGAPMDDAATDQLVRAMATAAGAQAPPAPMRRRHWRRKALRLVPLALLLIVSAVVLGLAAAKQRHPTTASTSQAPPPDQTLTTRELSLRFPGSWQRVSPPALHGLVLHHAVAVASAGSPTGSLDLGFGDPQTGNPLPARFIAATLTGTPTEQIVTLGPHQFYRVLDPRLSLHAPSQSVYALSTPAGPVIAVCKTATQAFTAECERVLATLRVTAASKSTAPSLSRSYAVALSRILSRLDRARAAAAHDLAIAAIPLTQARAADRMARLHVQAAAAVAGLHAGRATGANAALARALRALGDAYSALDRAALRIAPTAYRAAQAQVASASKSADSALGKLTALGYKVR